MSARRSHLLTLLVTLVAVMGVHDMIAQGDPNASIYTEGLGFQQREQLLGKGSSGRFKTVPDTLLHAALSDRKLRADPARRAWTDFLQGASAMQQRDYQVAVSAFEKARNSFVEVDDAWGMNACDHGLGRAYITLGQMGNAAPLLQRSLQQSQLLHDTARWYMTLDALGGIQGAQEDLAASQRSYEEGIRLSHLFGDGWWEHQMRRSLANLFGRIGELERANEQLIIAEAVMVDCCANDSNMIASLRVEKASLAALQGRHREALELLESVQGVFEARNNWPWATFIRALRSEELRTLGRSTEAVEQALIGYQQASQRNLLKETMDNLLALHKAHAAAGNSEQAYTRLLEYIAYKDSVLSRESITTVATMEQAYAYEKDLLADSLQYAKERVVLELDRVRAERLRNAYLFGGMAVLVLAIGLWYRLQFISRARKESDILRHRAEESEKAKHQFLANMSHEIRTPMNAIMGMTGILRRNHHLPEQDKYLDAVAQSSENLLVILNDILDLSKIQAGRIDLERVPFDPRNVVGNVKEILQFKADEKGLALVLDVVPSVPPALIGDPARLNQVLVNLLGNAIKFTSTGGVTIGVSAKSLEGERTLLEVKVTDTGIGIAADKLDKIFEEFTQAYADTTRKYGGTGLGLTISKRLVELQGGTITVHSAPGEGSTFTVCIPYTIGEVGHTLSSTNGRRGDLRDLRILLAEDNEFNALVAQDELADAIPGVRVDRAENGTIAVHLAGAADYDVILMDVQMPEMNGYDATRAIRSLPNGKSRTPIIAMTANVMEAELRLCREAGMTGHIPKPFTREELVNAMRAVLSNGRSGT